MKTYMAKSEDFDKKWFLIDGEGNIAQVWRKVKVPGHAEAVLEAAQSL